MGTKEPRQRTKLIQVRCTPEEYDRIHRSALAGGITVAEYVRRISLHRRIELKSAEPINLVALIAEIVRIGKKQRALARNNGDLDYSDISEDISNLIFEGERYLEGHTTALKELNIISELKRLGGLQKHLYLQMQDQMTTELSQQFSEVLRSIVKTIDDMGIRNETDSAEENPS
jgi:protein required for attachment to host cells